MTQSYSEKGQRELLTILLVSWLASIPLRLVAAFSLSFPPREVSNLPPICLCFWKILLRALSKWWKSAVIWRSRGFVPKWRSSCRVSSWPSGAGYRQWQSRHVHHCITRLTRDFWNIPFFYYSIYYSNLIFPISYLLSAGKYSHTIFLVRTKFYLSTRTYCDSTPWNRWNPVQWQDNCSAVLLRSVK